MRKPKFVELGESKKTLSSNLGDISGIVKAYSDSGNPMREYHVKNVVQGLICVLSQVPSVDPSSWVGKVDKRSKRGRWDILTRAHKRPHGELQRRVLGEFADYVKSCVDVSKMTEFETGPLPARSGWGKL